jgi:undecaprenyl pyrophosphate phosphatase UppP
MRLDLLAYAGPDQIMTVTSGLASILGVLLIFWHKVTAFCRRILNHFRGTPAATATEEKQIPPST